MFLGQQYISKRVLMVEASDKKVKIHSGLIHVRVFGFDSLVLARPGRNNLFTSAELKGLIRISYHDLQTILF